FDCDSRTAAHVTAHGHDDFFTRERCRVNGRSKSLAQPQFFSRHWIIPNQSIGKVHDHFVMVLRLHNNRAAPGTGGSAAASAAPAGAPRTSARATGPARASTPWTSEVRPRQHRIESIA